MNSQLLDDFFAEADEHLLAIRQAVLQLEASAGDAHPDAKSIGDLFLNIHSFKGIAAIVGLEAGEALAHATEDWLRLLRDGKAELDTQGVEILTTSARTLEQIVAAFRLRTEGPEIGMVLAGLKRQCETAQAPGDGEATKARPADTSLTSRLADAKARGQLWKFTFSPSRDLDARGININSVRDELAKVGELLKATPVVSAGTIVFEFLVVMGEAPQARAWEANGMVVRPAEDAELQSAPVSSPAPLPTEAATHNPFLAPSHNVRVDLNRLDELMRITGELVIQRSRLDTQLKRLSGGGGQADLRGAQEISAGIGRSLRELREGVMRVRLVPVGEIFARLPFVVRDLAARSEKKVRLQLEGQDTAMDKYVIERLKDPLLHLVRNAFSHGVENPAERAAASKPEQATITLKAATVGDSVVLQVHDDGKGINREAIIERARALGKEVTTPVDNASLLQILCSPGFSTRQEADHAAGRGVGMAVVHSAVRELGGNFSMESEAGAGTRFTLRLPLTLAIAETLIISAAGQTCAVPQSFVREILQATESQIQIVNGVEAIPYRSGVLPVVRLAGLFQLAGKEKAQKYVLVIMSERGSVGLLAEEVLGQREVVVSALRDPLIQVAGISGATELGDGKPVLILDGTALTSGSVRPPEFPGTAMGNN